MNFATGFNLPPFWMNRPVNVMPLPEGGEQHPVVVPRYDADFDADEVNNNQYLGNLWQDSVRIKWQDEGESEWWRLPLDPVVSVTCKNIIVRRRVLKTSADVKRRGTIKETWSQDDYEINIAGVLINSQYNELPEAELRRLRRYCEERKPLMIESALFSIFNINRMVVEDYQLPFTKGIENQTYTIKGYSDDDYELLIKS
jgi:hypothetical protein